MNPNAVKEQVSIMLNLALFVVLFEENREDVPFVPELYQDYSVVLMMCAVEKPRLFKQVLDRFPELKEIQHSVDMTKKLVRSRSLYYPELDALLDRLMLPSK